MKMPVSIRIFSSFVVPVPGMEVRRKEGNVSVRSKEQQIMSAKEALSRFVNDGDHLCIGNYTVGACMELVYEVIGQERKSLTLYSQSGVMDVEVLVGSGCADRLVATYVYRAGGKLGGSAVERALHAGRLQREDYSNFQYNARMVAGLHGFSYMQVLQGAIATDLFRERSFLGEDKIKGFIPERKSSVAIFEDE
jgi:glutaconate CoA-transferase subunit A